MFKRNPKPARHNQRPTRPAHRSSHAARQNRKRLFLETLEPRIVLSSMPQLIDLNPDGASSPNEFVQVGDVALFVANDGTNGRELWKTDGTPAGTVLLKDIQSGSTGSSPTGLTKINGTVFFSADDGVNGRELWQSDGTAAGTVMVKDLYAGTSLDSGSSTYAPNSSDPQNLTDVNGKLFFTADDGSNGRELWVSDDTAAGTVLVKDIYTGDDSYYGTPNNSYPFYLKNVNGTLFFSAYSDSTGRELWQSDGTTAGTVLVADAVSGVTGLYPNSLETLNGVLLFSGNDGSRELWTLQSEGEGTTGTARLTIFTSGTRVMIPANVGVQSDGSTASAFTTDTSGTLTLESVGIQKLGDFFDTWRTDGGLAGNNTTAVLSGTQLLGSVADATSTVQMFVNGQISTEFNNYVLQNGDEIVLVYGSNPIVSLNTNFGPIVIELFESQTPGTVENFLNYVHDGDFDNSIFHRSVTDFVIQGGGFTTMSTTFSSTEQFTEIPADAAITNEPGISNVRGTIAMAKLSGDPDSATSQFFVNLSDDNTFLDAETYDSFTVFGQVLDMATVDEIAALPTDTSNASAFAELPLSDTGQLAVIQSIVGQATFTGVKFLDANANGVRDTGESGIAGVTVFHGTDMFAYTASDGATTSAETIVTITVTPANDAPVAVADTFRVSVGEPLVVAAASGVLVNDTDADGDVLTATVIVGPANGSLTLDSDSPPATPPDSASRPGPLPPDEQERLVVRPGQARP